MVKQISRAGPTEFMRRSLHEINAVPFVTDLQSGPTYSHISVEQSLENDDQVFGPTVAGAPATGPNTRRLAVPAARLKW